MTFAQLNFAAATPEIFLAVSAMVLLILGVFQGDKFTRPLSWLAAIVLCIARLSGRGMWHLRPAPIRLSAASSSSMALPAS